MRHLVAISALCVAVWFLYAPATNRVFAADQLWYFAELNGEILVPGSLLGRRGRFRRPVVEQTGKLRA